MKHKIMKLIKRDLIFGFENNKYKFIGIFIVFVVVAWFNILNLKGQAFELGLCYTDINFIDLFFIMFKGVDYNILPLPINWILINIYITYLIGSYCYDDLSEESSHMIVRMNNRKDIWISKVIWMIVTICIFYAILLLIIAFFSIVMFDTSFKWSNFSKVSILNIIQKDYGSIQFILFTITIYILSSMTLSIFQMLVSFIIKPTYIYIVNILILIMSLYFDFLLIPIQGSLILRQNIFDITYPINLLSSIIYNLVAFTIIFIIGVRYIKKFDMLVSQKTD